MKLVMKLVCVTFLAMIVTSTIAADKKAGSGPNPYRDCGIGAALFANTAWAAVTSNVIWDLGITALTSATSSPETCSGKNIQTAQFVIDNYDSLIEETAKGQGEHLVAVLDIQGCDVNDRQAAISSIRGNVVNTVSSEGYENQKMVDRATIYYNAIESAVSTSCSV